MLDYARAANASRICVKSRIYGLDREGHQLAKTAPFLKKSKLLSLLPKRKFATSHRFSTYWLPDWTEAADDVAR